MERLAVNLTAISGQSLNQTAFAQTVEYSKQTSTLWRAVLETASYRPSPITFTDVCIHMGPAVILRGTPAAVAYYRRLKAELEDRICRGQGAISNERFRIYWEGMPIWGKLRFFAETMAAMNLSLVASTYGHSWVFDSLDPSEPFLSTAKASIELFTVRDEPTKEAFLKRIMDRFQVDGIIYHNSKTCPNCSNSRYGMPQRLTRETGIPHLVLDGDLNDLRCFSQEQTMTNLEAFAEMLAQQGATA
jgi:benzoyl-CoA reductase/2-hydroxyglutaryl-CoA dehydratase subunit BcrC/BadD/HgdB